MAGMRKLNRSVKRAQGINTRTGPAKASDGTEKGPGSLPSRAAMNRAALLQKRIESGTTRRARGLK